MASRRMEAPEPEAQTPAVVRPTSPSEEVERAEADLQTEAETDRPTGWLRLRGLGSAQLTRTKLLIGVLAMALGFAAVTQVRQTHASGLENLRQADLVTLLGSVNNQSARLQKDAEELTRTRDQLRADGGDSAARAAAQERLDSLGILAGTVRATGPGIQISIADPRRGATAASLLDTVQELRDAGAEAIQVNDTRVVASTWIGTDGSKRLVVDGTALNPPYRVLAIGDPHTMATAMAIPGGVVESLRQAGATATVTEQKAVNITAVRAATTGGYARTTGDG